MAVARATDHSDPRPVDDPIVALATPWGESAIAVVRAAGVGCLERAAALFRGRRSPARVPGYTLLHGRMVDPGSAEEVDEVLLAVFRSPRSYTGQDGIEVSCHGGTAVVARLLSLFLSNGFRQAGPGEFTLRAFLNGRMDLTRAEAVNEIVRARSDRARSLALSRLSGSVAGRIDAVKARLVLLLGRVELSLDYPEDEIDAPPPDPREAREARGEVERLLATYATGRLIQEGARLVVAGRTNAGKSTLFNLLLREDRSIVSEAPGTTRDYIEGSISIGGVGLRVFDTAGLRAAEGEVEREGIERTLRVMESADVVLYLVDGAAGLHDDDRLAMASVPASRLLMVWTKTDLGGAAPPEGFLGVSARSGAGLPKVNDAILRCLYGGRSSLDEAAVIDSLRQKLLLERCRDAMGRVASALDEAVPLDLVAVDLREALDALGEITGEITTADVLEAMFGAFCVGK